MKVAQWQYDSLLERVHVLESRIGHYGESEGNIKGVSPWVVLTMLLDYLGLEVKPSQPMITNKGG